MTSPIFKTIDVRAILGASAIFALSACASSAPTQQLVDARRTFKEAQGSEAARLTPDTLLSAEQALQSAEKAHENDPGSNQEAHLAYVAQRKAQIAISQGEIAAAAKSEQSARSAYQSKLEQSATANQRQVADMNNQLKAAQQGKQEAEVRAAAAMASLQEVATVKEEQRGTVITLSGAVLFPSGGDKLSAASQSSLDQVAQALQEQPSGAHILVEGHTDARGSDTTNEQLSARRAQAVSDYLAQKGVERSALEPIGRGEAAPVASNDTPDGRASNRRVEIVIEPAKPRDVVGSAPSKAPSTATSAKMAPTTPSQSPIAR